MYKLEELIEINEIQPILEDFRDISDTTVIVINIRGEILVESTKSDLYKIIYEKNKEKYVKCSTINYLGIKGRYKTTNCHLGLETISIPIKVFDTTIGFIVMSQFFTKEPNIKYFEDRATSFGLNRIEFIKAIKKIPVISEKKLKGYINFISRFSGLISRTSYKKLKQKEKGNLIESSNILLEKEINKQTYELIKANFMYRESREKYKSLIDFLPDVIYVIVEGRIKFANVAAQNFFGAEKITDLIGIHEKEFIKIHPSEKHKMKHFMNKVSS